MAVSDLSSQVRSATSTDENTPPPARMREGENPIDFLRPNTDIHAFVLNYLVERIETSERAMSNFHARWRVNEAKYQAYISYNDYEKVLESMNKASKAPQVISIQVPYSFATVTTINTYMLQTFCGRNPIMQISANNPAHTKNAKTMQQVMQYNLDHSKFVRHFNRFGQDQQVYGVGVFVNKWCNQREKRTQALPYKNFNILGMLSKTGMSRQRLEKLVYSGNDMETIDPFMFFPDPRVPMSEVNKRGEYVFWRKFEGKHMLKRQEAQGYFKWIDQASDRLPQSKWSGAGDSDRALRSGGEAIPGQIHGDTAAIKNYRQLDQGTVDIIPKELGLGSSSFPEKWLFAIVNKSQIVQAQRFDADHNMHPVSVAEPYELGYGFGNCGIMDYLSPIQDTISWFLNSHIYNVRAALNNMLVVDPSMVEMQDLKNPEPGKLIRLKRAAYGQDVRSIVQQLQIFDVTQGHSDAAQMFVKLGQYLTGVTDNMMGLQDTGGRKTASEVRITNQAGASRLAAQARIVSAQAMCDLGNQMSLNLQQYLDDEFFYYVMGDKGQQEPLKVSAPDLIGDYTFPINDGSLPLDNVALFEVWKEILLGVAQSQVLSQQFSLPDIFKFTAELGGARNIEQFQIQPTAQPGGPGMMPLTPQVQAQMMGQPPAPPGMPQLAPPAGPAPFPEAMAAQ